MQHQKSVLRTSDLKPKQIEEITSIIKSAFLRPRAAITFALERNQYIGLATGSDGKIFSYLFFNNEEIWTDGTATGIVYFGMIAHAPRGRIGTSLGLLRFVLSEQRTSKEGVQLGWGRTASPLLIPLIRYAFRRVTPSELGIACARDEQIFEAIARQQNAKTSEGAPFHHVGAAKHIYTADEFRRLKNHRAAAPYLGLFERIGFQQERGDRIAFLGEF